MSENGSDDRTAVNPQTSAHLLEGRWTRSRPLTPADEEFAYQLAILFS